jgi:hypothetical protein
MSDDPAITWVYGALSLAGAGFIVVSFVALRELWQRDLMRMVLWMAVSDFFFSLKFWLPAISGQLFP